MNTFDVLYEKLTTMGVQDFVSIVAALIAILAALYARWSARAAERANDIAIHTERLHIFKAIRHFQHELETAGLEFSDGALAQFIRGAELAEFYFAPTLANSVVALVDQSQDFLNERAQTWVQDSYGQPLISEGSRKHLSIIHLALLNNIKQFLEKMKGELRLIGT